MGAVMFKCEKCECRDCARRVAGTPCRMACNLCGKYGQVNGCTKKAKFTAPAFGGERRDVRNINAVL